MSQPIAGQFIPVPPTHPPSDTMPVQADSRGYLIINGADYETVAASQTDQVMGATGAVGDYIASLLVTPETDAPGAISIKDGNGSAMTVYVGGTSVPLQPFVVPLGFKARNATTPGWRITTGANLHLIATGTFT